MKVLFMLITMAQSLASDIPTYMQFRQYTRGRK